MIVRTGPSSGPHTESSALFMPHRDMSATALSSRDIKAEMDEPVRETARMMSSSPPGPLQNNKPSASDMDDSFPEASHQPVIEESEPSKSEQDSVSIKTPEDPGDKSKIVNAVLLRAQVAKVSLRTQLSSICNKSIPNSYLDIYALDSRSLHLRPQRVGSNYQWQQSSLISRRWRHRRRQHINVKIIIDERWLL